MTTIPKLIRLTPDVALEPFPLFPETEISAGARDSNGKILFHDSTLWVTVGVWESEANLGRWMHWPVDEFMVIVAGEVVIVEEDRETVVQAGESFFIPKGRRCIWNQSGYARKYMLMVDDGTNPVASLPVVKVDPDASLTVAPPLPAEILLSAAPVQRDSTLFRNQAGCLTGGVWESTAYSRRLIDFPRHEMMHLLDGSMTLTDGNGDSQTIMAGETVFLPMGTPNAWVSSATVRKVYCSVQPE